jgi:hypothetical protein
MQHYKLRPTWPSSGVQNAGLKEPAALLSGDSVFHFDVKASKIFYFRSFLVYDAVVALFVCMCLDYVLFMCWLYPFVLCVAVLSL